VHRPWPVPDRPWIMTQTWHDLLFAHWPIDPDLLARKLPPELPKVWPIASGIVAQIFPGSFLNPVRRCGRRSPSRAA